MTTKAICPTLLVALVGLCGAAHAEQFRLLAWNVESNRPNAPKVSDAGVIREQLAGLLQAPNTRAQIVALSEVEPQAVPDYKAAVAEGLDTEVDFVTAMVTSIRAVLASPIPMLGWGVVVTAATLVALAPFFLGLLVILPVLGHATWHLYALAKEPALAQ